MSKTTLKLHVYKQFNNITVPIFGFLRLEESGSLPRRPEFLMKKRPVLGRPWVAKSNTHLYCWISPKIINVRGQRAYLIISHGLASNAANTIFLKYPINPFTGTVLSLFVNFCFFPIINRPLLGRRALTFTYFCSAVLLSYYYLFNPHDDNAFFESIAHRHYGVPCITLYNSTTTRLLHVLKPGSFETDCLICWKPEKKYTPTWRRRQSLAYAVRHKCIILDARRSSMTRMRFTPGKRAVYFCTFYV